MNKNLATYLSRVREADESSHLIGGRSKHLVESEVITFQNLYESFR
jgi:hypothetical protein